MSKTQTKPGRSAFALNDVNGVLSPSIDGISGDASNPLQMLEQMQQLNARLEHQNQQLTALYEIGRTLASTLDLHEIYWTMYRQIAQGLLGASVLFVALFDQRSQTIYGGFGAVDGQEMDAGQLPRIPLGDGPVSDTIRQREPRIVDIQGLLESLQTSGRAIQVGDQREPLSALYVPMISENRVVGVMNLQHYEARAFDTTDLALVSILANQAAISLENARLFEQVQNHNVELEQHVAERIRDLADANERLKELDHLKDEFLSNVSHEFRTPLASVKLYLQLLARGRPEKREEYQRTLQRETLRLETLIEDLLDLSRLNSRATSFHFEPTNINYLLVELIQDRAAMAAERGLIFDCQLAADLPLTMIDPSRFTQVMSNLTTNAINYTPAGGVITLTTAIKQEDDSDWVTFTVCDTGRGISPQEMLHLFERFYRGEASQKSTTHGTGLGLAICKQLVEQMGGHITVESELGVGAAFTVWLKPAH
ncbi:MAG: GAF domain-containing sensor histidine kinase [Chloroflexi bacterium]|nr:GAF domain-containing sensor histidine kinase [Chloroflexota bacterium]